MLQPKRNTRREDRWCTRFLPNSQMYTVHKERNSGGLPFGKQYNNNDLFGHIID